jgi:hypothetical protein
VQDDLRLPALHEVSDEAAVDAEEHQAAAGPQHPLDLGERRRDVVHVGVHVGEHDHAGRGAPHRAPGHVRAHQVLQAPPSGTWSCPADSSRSITLRPVPSITAAAAGRVQAPALAGAEQPG